MSNANGRRCVFAALAGRSISIALVLNQGRSTDVTFSAHRGVRMPDELPEVVRQLIDTQLIHSIAKSAP
jgi:hypothetical protein